MEFAAGRNGERGEGEEAGGRREGSDAPKNLIAFGFACSGFYISLSCLGFWGAAFRIYARVSFGVLACWMHIEVRVNPKSEVARKMVYLPID